MVMNERDAKLPEGIDPSLSAVYRAAPAESPPAQLDADIQAAARRAVSARPQAIGYAFLRAWRVPLSIAAVLVMSVSMVTLTVRQKGAQLPESDYAGPATAQRSEVLPPPATGVRPDPGKAVVENKAEHVTKPAVESGAAAVEAPAGRAPVAAKAGPPSELAREQGSAVGSIATRENLANSPTAESAAPAKERLAAAPARQLAKGLGAPAAAIADSAASADGGSTQGAQAEAGVSGMATNTLSQVSVYIKELDRQPAEKWLEKIAALRQQGNTADADALLAEFRKRYPNHPLPFATR